MKFERDERKEGFGLMIRRTHRSSSLYSSSSLIRDGRTGGRADVRSNLMKLINYCFCCCCFCFALFVLQQDQFTFFPRSVLPFNLYFITLIELWCYSFSSSSSSYDYVMDWTVLCEIVVLWMFAFDARCFTSRTIYFFLSKGRGKKVTYQKKKWWQQQQ